MNLVEPQVLAAVFCTFLLAGLVKGVIGLGLPTVSLGLLTALFDLPTAMTLMIVPSFATNLWQASVGGHGLALLRRLWPFLLLATGTIWIGALTLSRWDLSLLSGLLGLLLVLYGGSALAGLRLSVPAPREAWLGPLFGATNGVLTGMTGSFVVPGVLYLQAIGLPRDQLVQAMGILFTLSTLALALSLHDAGLSTAALDLASLLALLPAILGMVIGQRLRGHLSEARFRQVFFASLLLLGAYIAGRTVIG